jgi:NADPH-dependent curcumin reductase CurA
MIEKVATLFMTGQLKYRTHTQRGLKSAIEGINLLFIGGNEGKLMVEL